MSFICKLQHFLYLGSHRTSLVAQMVKRLSTMWETRVRSLGQEDPLEKEMAIHSRTIAWKIPWTEEPGRLQFMGSQRVGQPPTSRGGILSLRGPERIPGIPVASQGEALSTGKARVTPGWCHHSQSPKMSQSIPGNHVFPALPRLPSEDRLTPRWHVGQPCG